MNLIEVYWALSYLCESAYQVGKIDDFKAILPEIIHAFITNENSKIKRSTLRILEIISWEKWFHTTTNREKLSAHLAASKEEDAQIILANIALV